MTNPTDDETRRPAREQPEARDERDEVRDERVGVGLHDEDVERRERPREAREAARRADRGRRRAGHADGAGEQRLEPALREHRADQRANDLLGRDKRHRHADEVDRRAYVEKTT